MGHLAASDDAGVPTVVVVPPMALDALAAAGADTQAYLAAVGELSETVRGRGLPFLDFTSAYDTSLFADPAHLNAAGTERFSRELATAVDSACAALDHDGDGGCR